MPRRFKSQAVSRRIHRSGGVPSFQWKSSRWRSILRCFRAKSSRACSRFFDFFLARECARFARLIALILRLKNSGDSISCPL